METQNPYITKAFSLINREHCRANIFNSDLSAHTDINKITQTLSDEWFSKCIEIICSKPKMIEHFLAESVKYDETKYHRENLITHLYCVGWICSLIADKYNIEPEFAFRLGFFHDIGKPWAKKFVQTKKKVITLSKGHAQVGENICCELGLDSHIVWSVSNHMCSCCHTNTNITHWEYVSALQTISLGKGLSNAEILSYANCLACLMVGDSLGRIGDIGPNYSNVFAHSNSWINWFREQVEKFNPVKNSVKILTNLHPDNSIVVQMFGHSGFGKSTAVKNLTKILDENNIVWEYAERDKSYYNIYSRENNLSYEDAIKCEYGEVYQYIETNDLKKDVQEDWIMQLDAILDSDSKVKIIDSVQMSYGESWKATLEALNPDAYSVWASSIKIGYYGFPQSLYGREFIPKTGRNELIPRDIADKFSWPSLNSELDSDEKFDPTFVDVAYGSVEFLSNTIINYSCWSQLFMPEKQVHLVQMLSQIEKSKLTSNYIQQYIQNQFPPGILNSNEELHYYDAHLIRFVYKDGMQIFHGPTRDYRGETILFDSSKLEYYIGRLSLPVFPDYSDLRKDPTTKELINTCTIFNIVPKFDGSLFVLALIRTGTPQYYMIKKLLNQVSSRAWRENRLGIWCFGSKGCMFAKDQYGDRGVLTRIVNSVVGSYGSIDAFVEKASLEVESSVYSDGNTYTSLSMVFEAIDKEPTEELTVDYGRAFCPFLCWIVWINDIGKKIILPNGILHLNPIASITQVNTWDEVIQFKEATHSRLLDGSDSDEPEGFVVWLSDTGIGVKLKHQEYYVAHKPYSSKNAQMAKHIEFSDEYSKLRTRLLKFKPKPPIKELVGKNMDFMLDLFLDNYKCLNSKKNWALFWKDEKNLHELNDILDVIENSIITYYPQFKNNLRNKGFSMAMDYFEKRDDWKDYFYSKYLKI